jgi:DNA polymerase-3 subunit alpha
MALIPDYIERKHGAKWTVPHPIMRDALEETFGIMVYQEQVMRICNRLGDIPLREAYTLIKAIGKKKLDVIAAEKKRFIEGCVKKGLTIIQGQEIFDLIERFAGYGFNKSHSTRYAIIAYQTAYMKTYWPVEYMAALLTYEMGDTDKVVSYIVECKEMGIEILAPDINESGVDFTPLYRGHGDERKGVIRFGLAAVKGVGEKAVEQLIVAREKAGRFQSLFHFCENVDLRAVNKQVLESLIKAGACDKLGGSRAQMLAGLENAMQIGTSLHADKQSGQMNFFGKSGKTDYSQDHERLPNVIPWPEMLMLAYEKEVLGFYVTSNPLSHHAETISLYSTLDTSQLADCTQDKNVVIGGLINKIRYHITQKGRNAGSKMAVFTLEDLQGQVEAVLFPDTLNSFGELLLKDTIVFVKGKLDYRREKPNIIVSELITLDQVKEKLAAKVKIRLDAKEVTKEKVAAIKTICQHHRGQSPVYVAVKTDKGRVYAAADKKLSVNPDVEFCKKMRQLVGDENFQLAK